MSENKVSMPTKLSMEDVHLINECYEAFEDGWCYWPQDMWLALTNKHSGLPEPSFLRDFRCSINTDPIDEDE